MQKNLCNWKRTMNLKSFTFQQSTKMHKTTHHHSVKTERCHLIDWMAGTFQWPFSAIHHSIAILILLNLIFHPTAKTTFSNKLWKMWQKKYKKGQPQNNIDYSYNFSNSYTTECYKSGSTKNISAYTCNCHPHDFM